MSNYDYFEKKNIPYDKPVLLFGNIRDRLLQKVCLHDFMQNYYMKYKNNHKICGKNDLKKFL